jgi:uncharacterized protein YuzB (UPF0349 family)
LNSVAQAVVGVLEHLDETKNRAVRVHDMAVSQNQLLALAKKVAPEKTKTWKPVLTSTVDIKKASDEAMAKGQITEQVIIEYLWLSYVGKGYNALFEKTDNELLGVAGDKTEADIEAIWGRLLK